MSQANPAPRRVTITIVYYGAPGAGKTTNLERLAPLIRPDATHRLVPRVAGGNRVFSIDVPSGSFGWLAGLDISVHAVTIQGAASGDEVWTEILGEANGVIFVASSSPWERADNTQALRKLRSLLDGLGPDHRQIPIVLQWNKRDLADARSVGELQNELNHDGLPSVAATAIRGIGVAETFTEILKRAVIAAYRAHGGATDAGPALERSIVQAVAGRMDASRGAAQRSIPLSPEFRGPAESARRVLRESASALLGSLERVASELATPSGAHGTEGVLLDLLAGAGRAQGSLLTLRERSAPVSEREAALVVPLTSDGQALGHLVVYASDGEAPPGPLETAYWKIAAGLISLRLARDAAKDADA